MRNKTRKLLKRKEFRINRSLQKFELGERLIIDVSPSIHTGMPALHRFQGKCGVVVKKQGNCYLVEVKDGNKIKTPLVGVEHLKRS